jgi:hypothetical protein
VTAAGQVVSTDPQCIYYMSLVVQAQADNIPDSPLHSALNQLVASVQARLMQHRGGASSSSDAGGCLAALYSAELCGICGDKVVFQPHSEDSVAAEGSALGGGGSVLHGSCAGCGVRAERCCYSLRLVRNRPTFSLVSAMVHTIVRAMDAASGGNTAPNVSSRQIYVSCAIENCVASK